MRQNQVKTSTLKPSKELWELVTEHLAQGQNFPNPELLASIRKLSSLFTEGRKDLSHDYLSIPGIAQAYLAYFVPLNFAKIQLLLSRHRGVWPADPGYQTLRWVDFGCGPGTATLAAMYCFKERYRKLEALPPLEIKLIDNQKGALQTAKALVLKFAEILGIEDITVHGLKDARPLLEETDERTVDLLLAANVLNEMHEPKQKEGEPYRDELTELWLRTRGLLLVLEPGHRVPSQRLSRWRERIRALANETGSTFHILGPCTHLEKCPVFRTDDWCHFSEPCFDGRLMDLSSRAFKDKRAWLKFSYLLLANGPAPQSDSATVVARAIGDLHKKDGGKVAIDLCRPESKTQFIAAHKDLTVELRDNLVRGARIEFKSEAAHDLLNQEKSQVRVNTKLIQVFPMSGRTTDRKK